MIRKFYEYNGSGGNKWLDEEDVILCIINLIDEGFIFDYQITDNGDNSGEIGLWKNETDAAEGTLYGTLYTDWGIKDNDILSKYQLDIWYGVLESCQKLCDVSGVYYEGEVSFERGLTTVCFTRIDYDLSPS